MLNPFVRRLGVLIACLLLGCSISNCFAHDIPGKATLLVYVKPEVTSEGKRLVVMMRAPLEAFNEVQFPVRGPGYLDFAKATDAFGDAARMYLTESLHFFADGEPLGEAQLVKAQAALPSDRSFTEYDSALAHINAPPVTVDDLYWKQALLDVLIVYPISPSVDIRTANFSVDASFVRIAMQTHTVLRFVPAEGAERIFDYVGSPGIIELEPGWWYAFAQFVKLGCIHILDGVDHLLFLFCLLIPARSVRALVPVITAFTLAHSITLISSALNLVPTAMWFPPLIETLIAVSIFYMACENMFGAQLHIRWLIVFCFGLVHGFGFSFILADRMQFAGAHLVSALLAFNVGVEIGQLIVLIVTVPLLRLAFKAVAKVPHGEPIGTILLSALAAHSAWHWLLERGETLLQYPWQRPNFDAAFYAASLRWLMLLMSCAAILWLLREALVRFNKRIHATPVGATQIGAE